MSVKVKLHLPVPEGRPGDEVELSQARAAALVDRRYASYVSGGSTAPDAEPEPEPEAEPEPEEETGAAPVVELPSQADKKADWVAAADALGLDTEGLTKEQVIEVVLEAT